MGERTPARDWYDALVGLQPTSPDPNGQTVFGLVKLTFAIHGRRLELTGPEPLLHPIPGEDGDPPMPPGSDFLPFKPFTDFVVEGSAFPPGGRPASRSEVRVQVGGYWRSIAVFGNREISWGRDGRPKIGEPEPFDEIPVTWENAYGGVDFRVEVPDIESVRELIAVHLDHPGLYPRNPFGRGYLVHADPMDDVEMPNLEDPHDLLTADRLVVGDPALWYRQPIPTCFEFMSVGAFPRKVYFGPGAEPWFPAPEDGTLPEVASGYLAAGYRSEMERRGGLDPRFFQGAPQGFIFPRLDPSTPVSVWGMHPERPVLEFDLPASAPAIELLVEGRPLGGEVRLHHVVCRPADMTVTLVYGIQARSPRTFLPGIHKRIPVCVRVGDDEPVWYDAPPTLHDLMSNAEPDEPLGEQDEPRSEQARPRGEPDDPRAEQDRPRGEEDDPPGRTRKPEPMEEGHG